jgi:hypothetical protein
VAEVDRLGADAAEAIHQGLEIHSPKTTVVQEK